MAKAISVMQPWAHLIVAGVKRIENRSWTTDYRGLVLIHASATFAREAYRDLRRLNVNIPDVLPRGALIGFAELVDVVTESPDLFFSGPFGFVLRNAQPLKKPIPMEGRLRLFNVGEIQL
jgi:hypothetical protein